MGEVERVPQDHPRLDGKHVGSLGPNGEHGVVVVADPRYVEQRLGTVEDPHQPPAFPYRKAEHLGRLRDPATRRDRRAATVGAEAEVVEKALELITAIPDERTSRQIGAHVRTASAERDQLPGAE